MLNTINIIAVSEPRINRVNAIDLAILPNVLISSSKLLIALKHVLIIDNGKVTPIVTKV